MSSILKPKTDRYTVADYLSWDDGERWELIGGVAYNMSPAPTIRHHDIGINFYSLLRNRLQGKPCKPFIAPVDVVLSDEDVVQPDVLVVCDPAKITPKNIQGAPDFVLEVLSPSTSRKDLREKKALYERARGGRIPCARPARTLCPTVPLRCRRALWRRGSVRAGRVSAIADIRRRGVGFEGDF